MITKEPKQVVSVQVERATVEQLREVAEREHRSLSSVIRSAIRAKLEQAVKP